MLFLDHRKTIKVIKVFCVICAPVTGIAKGTVMAHKNRCLLVRHVTSNDFDDQWIGKNISKIETKYKSSGKMPTGCFKWLSSNHSKLRESSGCFGNSTIGCIV